jgi:hypothetical protein
MGGGDGSMPQFLDEEDVGVGCLEEGREHLGLLTNVDRCDGEGVFRH